MLRLLAKEGGINIVTSDEVAGSVTMSRQVPWDQALEIILRTKNLGMVNEGQIIELHPQESIAKEREAEAQEPGSPGKVEAPRSEADHGQSRDGSRFDSETPKRIVRQGARRNLTNEPTR